MTKHLAVIRSVLLCAVLLATGATANAALSEWQSNAYTFTELIPDRNSRVNVTAIYTEPQGFGWIGTDNGLYILLGNKTFSRHTTAEGILPSDKITNITGDSHGTVWILTDAGMVGFQSLIHSTNNRIVLKTGTECVTTSVIADEDDVYFGARGRIYKYSYKTGEFCEAVQIACDTTYTPSYLLKGLHGDIVALERSGKNYYVYNTKAGTLRPAAHKPEGRIGGAAIDSQGNLWYSIHRSNIRCLNPSGEIIKEYTLETTYRFKFIKEITEFDSMICVSSDGNGLYTINPETDEVCNLCPDDATSSGIPTFFANILHNDGNGHLWCSMLSGGLFVMSHPSLRSFPRDAFTPPLPPEGIGAFLNDRESNSVWIATKGNQFLEYHPESIEFESHFLNRGFNANSLAFLDERIAMSATNSLGQFYVPNRKKAMENLNADIGSYLSNDADNRILILKDKVTIWDQARNLIGFQTIPPYPVEGVLKAVTCSNASFIHDNRTIYRFNLNAAEMYKRVFALPEGHTIKSCSMDFDGDLWLLDGNDLIRVNGADGSSQTVFSFNRHTYSLICATKGDIWICSHDRIYKYNKYNQACISLGDVDGVFENEYSPDATLLAKNGDVYLGGRNGFLQILSGGTQRNSACDAKIGLAGVYIDGELYTNTAELKVPFTHNSLNLRIIASTSDILSPILYHIKITGPQNFVLEKDLDEPQVSTSKLSPGKYTVWASYTRENGLWTPLNVIYTFKVSAPWYRQWWSLLIMFLIAGVILAWLLLHRVKLHEEEIDTSSTNERYNFLINVNHELRTPLTLVVGPLRRILRTSNLEDKDRESLERVCHQAERMTNLLNTILTTSKLQEGATKPVMEPTALNTWLQDNSDEFRDEAYTHGMPIDVKCDPSIGLVPMDKNLCKIVFSNMMTNALKHNETGERIMVRSAWSEDGEMIRISVRDFGTGIGDVDVSKLFERYYQATEERSGFGIGLAYSKTIVDAHHGRIGAFNNTDDRGATFWFEIPAPDGRAQADTTAQPTPVLPRQHTQQAVEPAGRATRKALKSKILLFVDDDSDLRDFVRDETLGVFNETLLAYNGQNALNILDTHGVDIVVTDLMMPEVDGIELCRIMKESKEYRHIPVIMLTARADNDSRVEGELAGADYYMAKPFETEDLLDAITRLLNK